MGKVNVIIVDATGNKEQKVGLPDDIKCGIIMVKLVEKIKLPSVGPDGNPISYKFIHKVTGRQLLEDKTLAEAGIKDGDVLRLQPEITAGAFCGKCGYEISAGASFCPKCGNIISAQPAQDYTQAAPAYTAQPAQDYTQAAPAYTAQPAPDYTQAAPGYTAQQPAPDYTQQAPQQPAFDTSKFTQVKNAATNFANAENKAKQLSNKISKASIFFPIAGIISGIVSIIFGIIEFSKYSGSYESNLSYGGDAYTGIQNAAAQTANNVQQLAEITQTGIGFLLIAFGLFMIFYFASKLKKN